MPQHVKVTHAFLILLLHAIDKTARIQVFGLAIASSRFCHTYTRYLQHSPSQPSLSRCTTLPFRAKAHPLSRTSSSLTALDLHNDSIGEASSLPSVPLVVATALVLFVAAQGWINSLASGDDGLGAFLQDGKKYKGSNFQLRENSNRAAAKDPLPWLKLPQLDFVEVAGQQERSESLPSAAERQVLLDQLENLRFEMKSNLQSGEIKKAEQTLAKLENLMAENDIEFNSSDSFQ